MRINPIASAHNHDEVYEKKGEIGLWQNWVPVFTGWAGKTAEGTFRYALIGKTCLVAIDMTAGTSNSATTSISLPVAPRSGISYGGANGMAINNGTLLSVASRWQIEAGSTVITFGTNMATGTFTASGTKRVQCLAVYEVE